MAINLFGKGGRHVRIGDEDLEPIEEPAESLKFEIPDVKPIDTSVPAPTDPKAQAMSLGLPWVNDLEKDYPAPTQEALDLLDSDLVRKYRLVPLSTDGESVTLAVSDPMDFRGPDDVTSITGLKTKMVVASKDDILRVINECYRSDAGIEDLQNQLALESIQTSNGDAASNDADSLMEGDDDSAIIQFVNKIIDQAINDRASDIHVEPREHDLVIRYRIDGVLQDAQHADKRISNQVISRLMVMASMDISNKRKPQDGRIRFHHVDQQIDLRVAALPTVTGVRITLRILDAPVSDMNLEDLNMLPNNLKAFQKGYKRPNGMVLLTGPTGSGKSTTLYTTLNEVASPDVNTITIEDPVEYRMDGVNQIQVNNAAGLTFAASLRSILRSDPDIILLGEIRDQETAKIAVESALTGHLVLSTLHTNDAPSTASRLIEMGVEPYLVSQSLSVVVAQRLARRLCTSCRQSITVTQEMLDELKVSDKDPSALPTIYGPKGCAECSWTGYHGRIAIQEVMLMDGKLESLVSREANTDEIGAAAQENGMTTLRDDCWDKVKLGYTSIDEVFRITASV